MTQHLKIQEALSKETYQMMIMLYGSINDVSLKPYYRTGKVKSFHIVKMSETEHSSRYKIKIQTVSGMSVYEFIDLVLQDGKWKVSKF